MKLLIAMLVLFFWQPNSGLAQQVTLKTGVFNKYLAKPGILFYDGPVWISEVTIAFGDFYFNYWSSTGIGQDPLLGDLGDEIDLGIGWKHSFEYLRFDVRLGYFMLNKLGQSYDDRWIVDLRADLLKCPIVEPYVAARFHGNISTKIPEGGWMMWVGVKRKQSLGFSFGTKEKVSLTADLSVMYSDGVARREAGVIYGRASLSLDIPITERVTLSPSIFHHQPSGDQTGLPGDYAAKPETAYGVMLKVVF